VDHLGSTREITNNSGAVVARFDFDPYGRMTKVSGTYNTVFGFTGHYHHAPSGLALPLYRAYAADLGQWTSEDPEGFVDGVNLYRYVRGNPVTLMDLTGEMTAMQGACLASVIFLLTTVVVVVTVTTAGAGTAALAAAGASGAATTGGIAVLTGVTATILFCSPPTAACMKREPEIIPLPPPPPPGHAICHRFKRTDTYCKYRCKSSSGATWEEQTAQPFCPAWYIQRGR